MLLKSPEELAGLVKLLTEHSNQDDGDRDKAAYHRAFNVGHIFRPGKMRM